MTELALDCPGFGPAAQEAADPEDLTGPASQGEGDNGPVKVPRIIGLDLSLTATGVAGAFGVEIIRSSGEEAATLVQRSQRLSRLRNKIRDWIIGADLVVIEGPAYGSRDGHAHDRSGLWWLVVRCCHANDIPVVEVVNSQLKVYATGKGTADKDQVLAAVVKRYPTVDIVNNNTADAYVLYAMARDALGHPLTTVPQTHRRALDNITWPEITP